MVNQAMNPEPQIHAIGGNTGTLKGKFLIIIDTFGKVREVSIDSLQKTRLFLGRTPAKPSGGMNDVVVPAPVISAEHGKFKIENDKVLYADLGSTNGTVYESDGYQKLLRRNPKYVQLRSGDMLRIEPVERTADNSVLILYVNSSEGGTWRRFPLLAAKTRIGRDMDNDIVLPHPSVSRFHCEVERDNSGHYTIRDNNSSNGLFVNGRKTRSQRLREKDVIRVANHTLIFTDGMLFYKNEAQGINIEVRNINKFVGSERKQILTGVNCTIESNEFVAIVGGSGAGKTTLMNAISGFDTKVQGDVFFNGVDVHKHFNELKELIGYVPQEDIIYDNLTLRKMLLYTAKLKMPADTTKAEMEKRIDNVLNMVDLSAHKNTFIRKLSGGQKKRASIAVEMLADPSVFFLDEPTSGLDPGTEQKLMITLNKLSKSQGKTIVMVTHTTQSLQLCDKVIFMGPGGRLCFQGDTEQAKMFFGTDNLVDVYNRIAEQPAEWAGQFARAMAPEKDSWTAAYIDNSMQPSGSQRQPTSAPPAPPAKKRKGRGLSQLPVLTGRYMELIRNDAQRLIMLFLQPLLIALLLIIVANKKTFFVAGDTQNVLFCLSCAGIWIGLFNSIQEICKERPILKREYMGNLRLRYYVTSKFLVQSILGMLQALLLTGVFVLFVGKPMEGILFSSPVPEMILSVFMTIETAMAMGFVISAMVKNTDRAMTTAPFVLIVQLLFSGILFELKGAGKYIAYITVSKWSMEALGSTAVLNDLPVSLQKSFPTMTRTAKDIFLSNPGHIFLNWGILACMMLVCAVICGI